MILGHHQSYWLTILIGIYYANGRRPRRHGRGSGAIARSEARDDQHSRRTTRVAAPTPEPGPNPSAGTPPPCLGPRPATGRNRTAPRNPLFPKQQSHFPKARRKHHAWIEPNERDHDGYGPDRDRRTDLHPGQGGRTDRW